MTFVKKAQLQEVLYRRVKVFHLAVIKTSAVGISDGKPNMIMADGGDWVRELVDLASKTARISDFEVTFCRRADFELSKEIQEMLHELNQASLQVGLSMNL